MTAKRSVGLRYSDADARRMHEARLEAVADLIARLGHDMNNSLNVVVNNLGILGDDPGFQGAHDVLDDAVSAGQEAVELTEKLLACAARQALRPSRVALSTLLEELVRLIRLTLDTEVALHTEVAAGLPLVRADPERLRTTLLELAVNAREAMPEGGTMGLAAAPAHIEASPGADAYDLNTGDYVRITLSDTGVGMDAATMSQLYEPYFSTKHPRTGRGFGLGMAYGFARQSGGGLRLTSAPGIGTAAALYLPVAPM